MNKKHPSAWDPAIMLLNILVSVIGSIIGLELIARLGISTNTSIIGALFAIIIARIPLKVFQKYKDINTQNLVQTAMSGATFAASNGIFLSIGIPYLLGRHDLVIPMLVGASLAVIIDATILYKVFDTEMFPAKEAWAPGIAAAEAMLAVAEKGKNSVILMIGIHRGTYDGTCKRVDIFTNVNLGGIAEVYAFVPCMGTEAFFSFWKHSQ